jgi:AcrR family transcriptional regulator
MARTPDLERRQELLDRIVVYLAASLDVSINRLVHHFGSKEELLAAALQRSIDQQIEVQDGWLARNPRLTMVEVYRKWWRWINESPANAALVRLNYEAAALDTKVTGLAGEFRADQIGVWRHAAEQRLEHDGVPHDRAVMEASLSKATFTGLVMDLVATGDRRRLNKVFEQFLERLAAVVASFST